MTAPSLGRQLRSGLAWSTLNAVVIRLGTFLMGIVAARMLAPEQFGVFAVALTVHAIVVNISDLGVSAYLVRHPGELDRVAPTLATVALALSGLLAGGMALAAPTIARLLGSPEAAESVRILSITVLLAGVSSIPNGLLTRFFRQDKRFLAEGCSFVVSNVILVLLALGGGGAVALAWSRVAGYAASTVMLLALSPVLYRPGFDSRELVSLLRFGLPLAGSTLLGFTLLNVDYVVISRLLGAEPLGLYYLAYNIAGWPFAVISPILASVGVAAFSRVLHRGLFAEYISSAVSLVMAVALPIAALLAALAVPLVLSLYGPTWAPAAHALSATALYGGVRVLIDVLSNAGIALGRTRTLLACQVVYGLVLVPVMVFAVQRSGIVGAAAAHVIVIIVALLPAYVLMLRSAVQVRVLVLARAVAPPALASGAAGLTAWWVASLSANSPWLALVTGGFAGVVVYGALLRKWLLRTVATSRRLWEGTAGEEVEVPLPRQPREGEGVASPSA